MEEPELVRRVQRGDMDAFETLFECYKTEALRTAVLMTGNRATAEDVVQETFIQCYQHLYALKNPAAFRSWFYTMLTRTAWRLAKKDKRATPIAEIFDAAEADRAPADAPSYDALYEAIAKLDLKKKTVVVLYYFNGFTVSEIAQATGSLPGTVKSRLHSARQTLYRFLDQEKEVPDYEKSSRPRRCPTPAPQKSR